jgi:hypothetical protein
MMNTHLRKYIISIIDQKKAPQIADNIPKDFGCVVSEPSSWLTPETLEKGLTFLDKKGNLLHSSIFKHQAYFHADIAASEERGIELLVSASLFEHYNFEKNDIKVLVTKCK